MRQPEPLASATPADLAPFDMIIDARSPSEFAEDHLPGAINLPVLDDEERARVGTIYVQQSPFLARKVGAALVAKNVARHLETVLADKEKDFRPLVYCWRGGQRSNSMAIILAQIGWRVGVLSGGYKTWRRAVQKRLYDEALGFSLVLLDGGTGSGKTATLGALAALGVQTLDLEAMAAHRGSVFGDIPGHPQPSQKAFESRLFSALVALDPARPVVVEAESSKVGDRILPPALWTAMEASPRIELFAEAGARGAFLARTYAHLIEDSDLLAKGLDRLPRHIGKAEREGFLTLAREGDGQGLARALIEAHYDPAYRRGRQDLAAAPLARIDMGDLSDEAVERAAREIADKVKAASLSVQG
jgi:tRNA 2-selenouridine synthase